MADFRAVICGGGIAAVEGLLRLRRLLGDSAHFELIAPEGEMVYRPLAVREPFAHGPSKRYPLRRAAADCGAQWFKDTLAWVEPDTQTMHTTAGQRVEYDALLIAVGAQQVEPYEHAGTFRDAEADAVYHGVVQDIEEDYSRSVAFILPVGPVWPLPLYELALMTAERANSLDIDKLELSLITPEVRPLAIFGATASDAVTRLLHSAGITVYCSALAQVPDTGQLLVQPQGLEIHPQRMIAMPRIRGPAIRGIAGGGAQGFVPIDKHCCVPGTGGRVFCAGDAAAFPIKHGGLGTQMADTAAASIASLAGADVAPTAFHPLIRGMLLTGADPLYLSARIVGAEGFESEVFQTPPWPADEKVVGEELGPYLAGLDSERTAARTGVTWSRTASEWRHHPSSSDHP
jgi:sulfide:quinone oxidoreductase